MSPWRPARTRPGRYLLFADRHVAPARRLLAVESFGRGFGRSRSSGRARGLARRSPSDALRKLFPSCFPFRGETTPTRRREIRPATELIWAAGVCGGRGGKRGGVGSESTTLLFTTIKCFYFFVFE